MSAAFSDSHNTTELPARAAQEALSRGFAPIPVPFGKKEPVLMKWPDLRYTAESVLDAFPGTSNIGLLCGAPSGGLYDVDCDTPEAIKAASFFLPATGMRHGRPGKPHSHSWYLCPGVDQSTIGYNEPPEKKGEKGARLVELRGTGGQTIIPPSLHPAGERYTWEGIGEPATHPYPDLRRAVNHLAACALLARAWPSTGTRDDAAMALSGGLVRAGWSVQDAGRFVQIVAQVAGDEEWESRDKAEASKRALKEKRETTGWPRLAELLINGEQVLKKARAWLGIQQESIFEQATRQEAAPLEPEGVAEILNTDAGNARRLVSVFGADIRYCAAWKTWLVWNGKVWERDADDLRLVRMAKRTVQALYQEAKQLVAELANRADEEIGLSDEEAAKRARKNQYAQSLLRWAEKSENGPRLQNMVALARSEPGIAVSPSLFDRTPFLLNVQNGTVDLATGALRGHSKEDYFSVLVPIDYDPSAECPRWLQFLDEVVTTPETIAFLRRAIGYTLTGDVREQCFFMLSGKGGNGKSTTMGVLHALLGALGHKARIETFLDPRWRSNGGNASPDVADMAGKRFVSPGEIRQGDKLNEALIKELTGGDTQNARQVYERGFTFQPLLKIWLYGNYDAQITGRDVGIWRRVRYIPFNKATYKEDDPGARQPDKLLPEKLRAELPGILAWAVGGCRDWLDNGLGVAQEVKEATAEYRARQDETGLFLSERCILEAGARVKKAELWSAYEDWKESRTVSRPFETAQKLSQELTTRGFQVVKVEGARYWQGIRLAHGDGGDGATIADTPELLPRSADQEPAGADGQPGQPGQLFSQKVPLENDFHDSKSSMQKVAPVAPPEAADQEPAGAKNGATIDKVAPPAKVTHSLICDCGSYLSWTPTLERLSTDFREQTYRMAEALRWPSLDLGDWQIKEEVDGWRPWRAFTEKAEAADLARVHEELLQYFPYRA